MSAHPAKRRKTSPLREITTPAANNERPRSSRASYMSPTRASLSRFNPDLLPKPRASTVGPSLPPAASIMTPEQLIAQGGSLFSNIMSNFTAQMQQVMASATRNPQSPAATGAPTTPLAVNLGEQQLDGPTGLETDEEMAAMRAAIQARKERERTEASSRARSSIARSSPRSTRARSEVKSEASPFREPSDDVDELSMDISHVPLSRRTPASVRPLSRGSERHRASATPLLEASANRSPEQALARPQAEEEDIDELSPDFVHVAQNVQRLQTTDEDLPDTPEALRRQLMAEDHPPRGVLLSSPLKRKHNRSRTKVPAKPEVSKPSDHERPQAVETANTRALKPTQPAIHARQDSGTMAATPEDERTKKEKRSKLERRLTTLQSEVDSFSQFAAALEAEQAYSPADLSTVLNLLAADQEPAAAPGSAVSASLTSFLPFSIPVPITSTETVEPEQFVSHAPLKEVNQLQYDRLFTPFTISAATSAPITDSENGIMKQVHRISISAPGSLLTCEAEMNVTTDISDNAAPMVENLVVTSLPTWARAEIGEWVDRCCLSKDIASFAYGLGRYWDISVRRAKCWAECHKLFPGLVAGDEQTSYGALTDSSALSKRQLIRHFGKSAFVLEDGSVSFRIKWTLHFDWTGEIQSAVEADVAVPEIWRENDDGNALRKIPKTFDALVRDGGVMKAVDVIGTLLFKTPA